MNEKHAYWRGPARSISRSHAHDCSLSFLQGVDDGGLVIFATDHAHGQRLQLVLRPEDVQALSRFLQQVERGK